MQSQDCPKQQRPEKNVLSPETKDWRLRSLEGGRGCNVWPVMSPGGGLDAQIGLYVMSPEGGPGRSACKVASKAAKGRQSPKMSDSSEAVRQDGQKRQKQMKTQMAQMPEARSNNYT